MTWWRLLFLLAFLPALTGLGSTTARAQHQVTDDTGRTIALPAPAQRVIALAPHLAELVHASGGGHSLVGITRYADHPDAVKTLPLVGDAHALDFERIAQLRPDLVLVWGSGTNERHKARLRSLGLVVFESEMRTAQAIADTLRRLGVLLGRADTAEAAARNFQQQWQALLDRHRGKPPVRVFWQVWNAPLMTVNREHLISEAIRACGGVNVFADLPLLTPTVGWEAAVAANPQLIAGAGRPEDAARDFATWQRFGEVSAVKQRRFATIDGSLIGRMTPRFVDGAAALCEAIERVR
jgi:iron complex transport system substrate-binding protein